MTSKTLTLLQKESRYRILRFIQFSQSYQTSPSEPGLSGEPHPGCYQTNCPHYPVSILVITTFVLPILNDLLRVSVLHTLHDRPRTPWSSPLQPTELPTGMVSLTLTFRPTHPSSLYSRPWAPSKLFSIGFLFLYTVFRTLEWCPFTYQSWLHHHSLTSTFTLVFPPFLTFSVLHLTPFLTPPTKDFCKELKT